MKNKLIAIVLGTVMAFSLAACGSAASSDEAEASGENTEEAETDSDSGEMTEEAAASVDLGDSVDGIELIEGDYVLEDCMELGEYKGLKAERVVEEVTDDDALTYIEEYYVSPVEVTDADATVAEGDTVNIDYEGTKDGVAFDGGSATGASLEIGSDSFIDGFEDGLIGMKAGEEKDLNLTFPEDYWNEELSGADVVFHVKVNSISRMPEELTDDWVNDVTYGEYTTLDDYVAFIKSGLEETNEASADSQLETDLWAMVIDNSTFKALPKEYVEEGAATFASSFETSAEYYGMELEDYLSTYCNMDMDQYEENMRDYGIQIAESMLVLEAIEKAENIGPDSDEYQERLDALAKEYGMETDEFVSTYGTDNSLEDYIMTTWAMEIIKENAEITESKA